MIGAISNPKKIIVVDLSIDKVKVGVERITLLSGKYKFTKSNPIFNQTTFEATEFASLGVYIDINLSSQSENKTEITIEIRRKIGSFDKSHEVTRANQHIENLLEILSKGISYTEAEFLNFQEVTKEDLKKNKQKEQQKNKSRFIILGAVVLLLFLLYKWAVVHNEELEKSVNKDFEQAQTSK
jgi:hypothetical protein